MEPRQQDWVWIYESPDGGETIYRRRDCDPHFRREQMNIEPDEGFYKKEMFRFRDDWDELADNHPGIREYLDKLLTLVRLIDE